MSKLKEIAAQVSNWGRWGEEDQKGTLNFITPEVVKGGAACVRRGDVISLGMTFGANGPQIGQGGRINPVHTMTVIDGAYGEGDQPFQFADDVIFMPLQCATQWDALAHAYYDSTLYNGFPSSTITVYGATRNSIESFADGIASRGVLLDLARQQGVERLAPSTLITPADLDAAAEAHGVEVRRGDVLLLRTGHIKWLYEEQDRDVYMRQLPGIGIDCVPWLHAKEVAALATDTSAVEVIPGEDPAVPLPVHRLCPRDMGLPFGEMFDLERLAEACATDGVYDFFFSAPPLRIAGGVGSPLNPLAIR